MSVWEVVEQFTSQEFILTVYDEYADEVIFEDLAWKVKHNPAGDLHAISMDPPIKGWHITINVDTSTDKYCLELENIILE